MVCGFFQKIARITTLLFVAQTNGTIAQPNVKCPNCATEIQEASRYCAACGKVPKVSSGPSYSTTWMFAIIGLCVVGFYWVAVTASRESAGPAPTPSPVPDSAATLIQHCGRPDKDSITPANLQPKASDRLSLLYRSARVRAVFERDAAQRSGGWKNVTYFDPASGKQLNSQQILKRLPCAATSTPSP